jgi:hypothetical protein
MANRQGITDPHAFCLVEIGAAHKELPAEGWASVAECWMGLSAYAGRECDAAKAAYPEAAKRIKARVFLKNGVYTHDPKIRKIMEELRATEPSAVGRSAAPSSAAPAAP